MLDHASGMATLAAHGVYHEPHFVLEVERKNRQTGRWQPGAAGDEKVTGEQTIDPRIADEVTWVLKQVAQEQDHTLREGRDVATKSGTWENGQHLGTHAHAWYVGYTEQIAAAVWVGSKDHNTTPIKDARGRDMFGSGLPGAMWEEFMNQAHADLGLPVKDLTDGTKGQLGDPDNGEFPYATVKPTPSPQPSPRPSPSPSKSPKPSPSVSISPEDGLAPEG